MTKKSTLGPGEAASAWALARFKSTNVVSRHHGVFPRAFLVNCWSLAPSSEPCTAIREQLTDWCTTNLPVQTFRFGGNRGSLTVSYPPMLTAPPPVANGGLGIRRDYGLSKDGKDQSLSRNRKCELRRGCPIQRLNWCWAGPRSGKSQPGSQILVPGDHFHILPLH